MSIGVALIGSGIFAKEEHLPAILATPSLKLKAIYSRSRASAEALVSSIATENVSIDIYSDDSGAGHTYHDLLLRPDVQGVIIALPILAQPEHIEAALLAGKHVLSEKPIAKDIKSAEQLIEFYESKIDQSKVTWAVAENFRFLDSFAWAAREVEKLGKVTGFRVKSSGFVKPGGKYFETPWRKTPAYQGGFLLDGGVHFVAATRLLLSSSTTPSSVCAFTSLLQPHLPPVDTLDSIWSTSSGATGTFSVSFGTTFKGSEYSVACEKGTVTVVRSKVTVMKSCVTTEEEEKQKVVRDFDDEGSGVKQEMKAWAEGILAGRPPAGMSPKMALGDLEVLQRMLESGEKGGEKLNLKLQG